MVASSNWLAAHLGPVEVVFLALPADAADEAWRALLAAVDSHQLRILDLEFVRRTDAGADVLGAEDLPAVALPELTGSNSHLLTSADLDLVVPQLEPGDLAAVLLVEHLSMLEVLSAFEAVGSRLLLDGVLDHQQLDDALTEADPQA